MALPPCVKCLVLLVTHPFDYTSLTLVVVTTVGTFGTVLPASPASWDRGGTFPTVLGSYFGMTGQTFPRGIIFPGIPPLLPVVTRE